MAHRRKHAFDRVRNRYKDRGALSSGWEALVLAYGVTIRDEGHREHVSGQADAYDEPRARVSSWPPLRPTRLRRERGSVVVVWPTAPVEPQERGAGDATRDRHGHPPHFRGGGFLEAGRLRPAGRIDMTRSGLEGLVAVKQGRRGRRRGNRQRDGVVRVLSPYVARVIVANPLQVKAIRMLTSRRTKWTQACWRRTGSWLPARGLAA